MRFTSLAVAITITLPLFGQADNPRLRQHFAPTVARLMKARAALTDKTMLADSLGTEITQLGPYISFISQDIAFVSALSELEQQRLNKQVGAPANAAGSTSLVSKGSVPALFGMAVENGALSRSISGTTVTFRTSPANLLNAIAKQAYLPAGPAVPPLDGSALAIAKRASMYVSFDTQRGLNQGESPVFRGDRQQLAGFGGRFDLVNKRDPRHPAYAAAWNLLMANEGQKLITPLTQLMQKVIANRTVPAVQSFLAWQQRTANAAVGATTEDEVWRTLETATSEFQTVYRDLADALPWFDAAARTVAAAQVDFFTRRNDLVARIMKSWTAAVEYDFVAQANTSGRVRAPDGAEVNLPDLGSINFVASRGFVDGPEFTLNAGLTWFQSIPSQLSTGRLRDLRASGQFDIPLREIHGIGSPLFSMAGQFINLREEPLGQTVVVNTVEVSTRGNIWLGQAKLKIPTKNTGVSFPLSVTWANRTELIKEKEVRANFGVTFDLDKLFARQ